jgi:hypothetical protein
LHHRSWDGSDYSAQDAPDCPPGLLDTTRRHGLQTLGGAVVAPSGDSPSGRMAALITDPLEAMVKLAEVPVWPEQGDTQRKGRVLVPVRGGPPCHVRARARPNETRP